MPLTLLTIVTNGGGGCEARSEKAMPLPLYDLPLQSLAWEPVAALYNRVTDDLMHFQVT